MRQMQSRFKLLGVAGALLAVPFGAREARADTRDGSVIARAAGTDAVAPGTGFDSRDRVFRDACVVGDVSYAGLNESTLDLRHTMSTSDVNNKITGTIGMTVDLLIASGSLTTSVSRLDDEHEYSRTLVYSNQIIGKPALVSNLRLTDVGQRAAATHDPAYIRLVCGDEAVVELRMGGSLYLTARLDFMTEEVQTEVDTTVKWSVLGFSDSKTWREVSDNVRKNSLITYGGVQLGGDPSQLDATLGDLRGKSCSLDDVAGCSAAVDKLVTYASGDAGFKAQMGDLSYSGPRSPVLAYRTMRYADMPGIKDQLAPSASPLMSLIIQQEIESLAESYKSHIQIGDRAKRMLAMTHMRPPMKDRVNAVAIAAQRNILRLGNALDACYATPLDCITVGTAASAALLYIDARDLVKVPTTYDFCIVDDPKTAPAVTALYAVAGLPRGTDATSCGKLEDELDKHATLDLGAKGITDLRPLRGITGVKTVNVRDNAIKGVDALSEYTTLESIDLSNNAVPTLAPLVHAAGLRRLDAGYNNLREITLLAQLPALEELRIYGNNITDYGPLAGLHALKQVWKTEADACEGQRVIASNAHLVTTDDLDFYRSVDFAPVFADRRNPTHGGITSWDLCASAVRTY